MSKYGARFKALEKKLPKQDMMGYSFYEYEPGIYWDNCENTYTMDELEELTCMVILFSEWYKFAENREKTDRDKEIAAKHLKEYRRLQYLYDKDRKRYGLKPPFANAKPEDIPEDCGPGWNKEFLTAGDE